MRGLIYFSSRSEELHFIVLGLRHLKKKKEKKTREFTQVLLTTKKKKKKKAREKKNLCFCFSVCAQLQDSNTECSCFFFFCRHVVLLSSVANNWFINDFPHEDEEEEEKESQGRIWNKNKKHQETAPNTVRKSAARLPTVSVILHVSLSLSSLLHRLFTSTKSTKTKRNYWRTHRPHGAET